MTLDSIMRDIEAMREDLLMFERKYGVPTEVFYEAYQRGEEPDDLGDHGRIFSASSASFGFSVACTRFSREVPSQRTSGAMTSTEE